jgi:two-component system LytT family sensor kinase
MMLEKEVGAVKDGRSPAPQWVWVAAIWFGFALLDATQLVLAMYSMGMQHAWVRLFLTTLLSWLPWMLTTLLVLRVAWRGPWLKLPPLLKWPAHILACLTTGLVSSAWTAWMEVLVNPYAYPSVGPFRALWFGKFYVGISSFLVFYAVILTVTYVLDARARLASQQTETARLNEQLAKAQLEALRRQIEPHFLFNTLNAVAGLVREGSNDTAVSMIVGLSDFLRRTLEDSPRQQVALEEEIEFAQGYLDIQKVRFAERLQLSVEVPKELYGALVPSLILQPMVENAIKHGIAKRLQGGAIQIAASRNNGMLMLSVGNDGPSLPLDWDAKRSGIGISNVRTRLQSLYGARCELTIKNRRAGGVEVSVSLPFAVAATSAGTASAVTPSVATPAVAPAAAKPAKEN